jgi:Zn-dependent protease with chaperone function
MNFFEAQAQARKASRRLVWLFALAVIAIVAAINVAVIFGLGLTGRFNVDDVERSASTVSGEGLVGIIAITTLVTLAVIGISSLVRIASLRSGGSAVARSMGGTPVTADTRDPKLRRLRNVVEEIAIASGVPVPEIYVLDHEEGINAFAAGYTPNDAVVAVTRGCARPAQPRRTAGRDRARVQPRAQRRHAAQHPLMGVLFGILVLGIVGRKVLEGARGGRDSKGLGAILLVALAIMIVGYIGVFFGRMIKAGVSRSREYLADASAVQFTRQTAGIAGALKKIGGLPSGSKLAAADTEEVSHMLFGDGVGFLVVVRHASPAARAYPRTRSQLQARGTRRARRALGETRAVGGGRGSGARIRPRRNPNGRRGEPAVGTGRHQPESRAQSPTRSARRRRTTTAAPASSARPCRRPCARPRNARTRRWRWCWPCCSTATTRSARGN